MSSIFSPTTPILISIGCCLALATRAWLRYQRTAIRERSKTARLHVAIQDTDPRRRVEILRAYGEAETRSLPPRSGTKRPP